MSNLEPPQRIVSADGSVYTLALHPEDTISLHVEMPSGLRERLRMRANEMDSTLKELTIQALTEFLSK